MSLFLKHKLLIIVYCLLLAILFAPKAVLAAECTITTNPQAPNQSMDKIVFTISSQTLGGSFGISFQGPSTQLTPDPWRDLHFNSSGIITSEVAKPANGWGAGTYTFYFFRGADNKAGRDNPLCTTSFTLSKATETPAQNCQVTISNTTINPDTNVQMSVANITGNGRDYDVWIDQQQKLVYNPNQATVSLGLFGVGTHIIEIRDRCGPAGCLEGYKSAGRIQCPAAAFQVVKRGETGGGQVTVVPTIQSPQSCQGSNCSSGGPITCDPATGKADLIPNTNHKTVYTAIGCIPTQPTEFIKGLLRFAMGIGGGVALILMIFGAFQMITSGGSPESLKKGQEQFTSAIIGLLFIIFSVLLLQIIGADILGIPGFGR